MEHPILSIEVVSDTDGFQALEPHWRDLFVRSSRVTIFQGFDWMWRAWTEITARRGYHLHLIVGRYDGRVVMIWPLMRDGRRLRFLGSDQFEYRDLIIDDSGPHDEWIQMAWNSITRAKHLDLALFNNMRADAVLVTFFSRHFADAIKRERSSWRVGLDHYSDWNEYMYELPTSLRQDQRRQWRRLQRLGPEPVFNICSEKDQAKELIDWLLDHKLDWLAKRATGSPIFKSREYRDFLKAVAVDLLTPGALLLATLEMDEKPIAANIGYIHGTDYWLHITTYDSKWHSYSPSRLLQEKTIHWCYEHGIKQFDFLPGQEEYKRIWGNNATISYNYVIPLTFWGKLLGKWQARRLPDIGASTNR